MKIAINTAELKTALAKVKGTLGSGANGENTKGITIQGKNGVLTLTATNGMATVRTAITARADDGLITVDGKNFIAFANRLPEGEVTMESDDKSLKAKVKGLRLKLPITADAVASEKVVKDQETGFAITADEFVSAVSSVLPCAARGSTRPVLNGIALRKNDAEGAVAVACDGFKLAKRPMTITANGDNSLAVILPVESVNAILTVINAEKGADTVWINQTGIKEAQLSVGDTTIFSSLIHGEYIDYRKLIPENKKLIDLDTAELIGAMETIAIAVSNSKESLPVKIQVAEGVVSVSGVSQSADCSITVDSAMTDGFEDEFIAGFNPAYLLSVLKTFDDETIRLAFNTSLTAMTITGKKLTTMILPVRLKD